MIDVATANPHEKASKVAPPCPSSLHQLRSLPCVLLQKRSIAFLPACATVADVPTRFVGHGPTDAKCYSHAEDKGTTTAITSQIECGQSPIPRLRRRHKYQRLPAACAPHPAPSLPAIRIGSPSTHQVATRLEEVHLLDFVVPGPPWQARTSTPTESYQRSSMASTSA